MVDDFPAGMVWLVGAGPGNPDLLTLKALRLIERADIVFHDALVGPAVLDYGPSATLVSVGKRSGKHSKDQETINRLIVEAALAGKRVVRLKGGDPSIFARAAEELEACATRGIAVRMCPGITAASAAAASGLAPLTQRNEARQLTFVTAHAHNGARLDLDWNMLAKANATLAVYMGRAAASEITNELIAAGRAPDTPVMIVVDISLPSERLVRGHLDTLPFLVKTLGDDAPTLLLIGSVCQAHNRSPIIDGAVRQNIMSQMQQRHRDFATAG